MKTIALDEKTFELISELKKRRKISSFNLLIKDILKKEDNVKESMFGALKGKTKSFTRKEREEIMGDESRWR